ncbi:Uma2 family endonuclease [Roseofilum casamattae]|uniref:Uma2 family endonuclease n=1 Tax=Roseofilum casamattae BLCC-M143 TaxID=3022442 RepID=A0ABT7BVB0_9CYAN|nr:Uma2 family endonuclease [Roseofilum casamattae]MDJ1183121.1 Uma2 family endonuclease [Roseofilum casamattae BLCC-M143]
MKVTVDIPAIALQELVAPTLSEQRITLHNISWQQYETLLTTLSPSPSLRLSYNQGLLEIMGTSTQHEIIKSLIRRLLETYASVEDLDFYSYGSATFRSEVAARGLEADESYCIGERRDVPDLAIEVVITSGGIDKLDIYQGLEIPEVWFWQNDGFTLYQLIDSATGYREIERSQLLPNLDISLLSQFMDPDREPQMVRAYHQALGQL